jgi:hypothetical protein
MMRSGKDILPNGGFAEMTPPRGLGIIPPLMAKAGVFHCLRQ